ncbi:hypothetical protein C7S18_06985 [Ahniella affigens]|uniref:CHAT domain-containing protein n=1 Tax=Ahniella affigens TaxID=2021234 RepID=A0A2P1PQ33_9GAMM|nr:CHAT domain-containing protein [Ahniella affigens]AVP96956.1 hypothetical protein C7S18_06985 [Ahniella affigens]
MNPRTALMPLLRMLLLASVGVSAEASVVVVATRSTAVDQPVPFQPGDELLTYRTQNATTDVEQPIVDAVSFRLLMLDDLLYGPITVKVRRGATLLDLELVDGKQDIQVRSQPEATELETIDDRWQLAIAEKNWTEAKSLHDAATRLATPSQMPLVHWRAIRSARGAYDFKRCQERVTEAQVSTTRAMLRIHYSEEASHCASFAGNWREGQKIQQASIAALDELAPDTLIHARFSANLGQIESFSDFKGGRARIEAAVAKARKHCDGCSDLGVILNFYGDVLGNGNLSVESEAAYREGVEIARKLNEPAMALAPRLRMHARSLRMLGRIKEAGAELQEALKLVQSAGVPAREQGPFLNGLGVIAAYVGDFHQAGRWFREAIALYPTTDESVEIANARHNLGWTLLQSGDLAAAEQEMRAANALMAKNDKGAMYALFLSNYAEVQFARGDDEGALATIDEAVAINQRINPNAYDTALCLIKQALFRSRLGNAAGATSAWKNAFAILEALPQDNLMLADPLTERGMEALARGDLKDARQSFDRAIALYRAETIGSLSMSRGLQGAGMLAITEKRFDVAEQLLAEALAIRRRDVPNSAQHAETVHSLGTLAEAREQPKRAREFYCQASNMLDDASLKVGGDSLDQARFRAIFAEIYRDCVFANIELGAAGPALEALERGRARGFRAALEMRQLQLRDPKERAALDALAINLAGEQEALTRANDPNLDAAQKDLARQQVAQLKQDRQQLRQRLERALPSLSARNLSELSARLHPDEAYVAFAIGAEGSAVLVLRSDGTVMAARLPMQAAALSAQITALRQLLNDPSRTSDWQLQTDRLRDQLFAPVMPALRGAKTLSISPDGALHNLPFAAIWDARQQRYWVDQYAITIVDALSARPESRDQPDDATGIQLLAVGDPIDPDQAEPSAALTAELRRSGATSLRPLPAARREVQLLAERYQRSAEVLLGSDASEARVRALAPKSRQLHFAVHALLDPEHVLDSSLVLYQKAPGSSQDDGFLRVHEIMTDLQLDADLVVLSACDTGLGKELAGEGLIGFSRAFAFAGTKATLASLWPVSDQSTETLMDHFYAARDRGQSAAQALQTAMQQSREAAREANEARRGVGGLAPANQSTARDTRHPFFWAAFQVYGE